MKIRLCCAGILAFFVFISCKKNNPSAGNTSGSDSYLSSITNYTYQAKLVDSFTYDNQQRITQMTELQYNTSYGVASSDSTSVEFTYTAGNPSPSSYVYNNEKQTEQHQLAYDPSGRIIKDTCISGTGYVARFTYAGNYITTFILLNGMPNYSQTDTLFITNGNISAENDSFAYNTGTGIEFDYASIASPAYHPAIANGIGPLLYFMQLDGYGYLFDMISKNVVNKISEYSSGLLFETVTNSGLLTDSKGRLARLTSSGGPFGTLVFSYY